MGHVRGPTQNQRLIRGARTTRTITDNRWPTATHGNICHMGPSLNLSREGTSGPCLRSFLLFPRLSPIHQNPKRCRHLTDRHKGMCISWINGLIWQGRSFTRCHSLHCISASLVRHQYVTSDHGGRAQQWLLQALLQQGGQVGCGTPIERSPWCTCSSTQHIPACLQAKVRQYKKIREQNVQ